MTILRLHYKFIFLLSYLDILKRWDISANEPISFRELTVEMLANSWYPHTYFKLSIGLRRSVSLLVRPTLTDSGLRTRPRLHRSIQGLYSGL